MKSFIPGILRSVVLLAAGTALGKITVLNHGQELTQCEYFKTSKSWSLVVIFSENFIAR